MAEPNDEYVRRATAHQRGGAGRHEDRRTRRRRTRQSRDRWARWEHEEDK
jgi:hypothetical protein